MIFAFDPYNLFFTAVVTAGLQAVLFLMAATLKTDKFTDITYSLNFVILALVLCAVTLDGEPHLRRILLTVAVSVWGLRLGAYLLIRIFKMGKDDRFDDKRDSFWSFAKFWIFQALVVWLILLPVTIAMSIVPQPEPGLPDYVGFALWLIGFVVEAVADQQKFAFKNDAANSGKWIQSGLWKYSRHPNYFGETLLWWGVFVLALPALFAAPVYMLLVALLGPVCITLILLFVSGIPLLEEKHEKRYGDLPEYQAYKARTNLFVPWFPRA